MSRWRPAKSGVATMIVKANRLMVWLSAGVIGSLECFGQGKGPDMPISCPRCGSDQVRSFEAVYSGGTSTFSARSRGSHDLVGYVDTSGQSSTEQAKLCTPPQKLQTFKVGCGIPFLGLILGFLLQVMKVGEVVLGVVLLGSLALGIWFIQHAVRFNSKVYPGLLAAWQRKWLCQSCHHQFEI